MRNPPRTAAASCLILAGLSMLFLPGCGGSAEGRGPVEVRYWTGWTGPALATQKELAAAFERSHPGIRVRVLSVAGSYQKVRISFAGGTTPDLCSAIWADELAGYAMRGVLRPLDGYLARSGRAGSEWVPGVWRMLQYRGRPYALAVTTNTNFIVYNKRIFREAGLDSERPPRTLAELDQAAAACTQYAPDGSFRRYGYRPLGLGLWGYVFGGQWYDPSTGAVTANHPANVAALRWMASYGKRYDLSRMQSFEGSFGRDTSANGPFFVGKVAMWQTGEWALAHLRRYAPTMEWGWFPLPPPPGGRTMTTGAGGSVFAIPVAAQHPEEAWEFLNFLTRPDPVQTFCEAIHNLPPLREVGERPAFQREPLFRFALDLAAGPNVFGPPQMPVWPRYQQEIRRAEDYGVFGRQDPQQLLDGVDERVEAELQRALREAR
jgi:ABC-type glycerol-3-phosphate transport system substrate-binding protein